MKLRKPDAAVQPLFMVDAIPGMQARFRSGPSSLAIPEAREMVAVARRYVAGECGAPHVYNAAYDCLRWANVYGAHPAIRALAYGWATLAEQVGAAERFLFADDYGNEWDPVRGPLPPDLPESALFERVLGDLGGAAPPVLRAPLPREGQHTGA